MTPDGFASFRGAVRCVAEVDFSVGSVAAIAWPVITGANNTNDITMPGNALLARAIIKAPYLRVTMAGGPRVSHLNFQRPLAVSNRPDTSYTDSNITLSAQQQSGALGPHTANTRDRDQPQMTPTVG